MSGLATEPILARDADGEGWPRIGTYWCLTCGPVLQELWPDSSVVIHRACRTIDVDQDDVVMQ